jgi:hypothetical protein
VIVPASFVKLLWMVITINGDVAGVLLNEPMPDYMTMADCVESARQQNELPANVAMNYRFHCIQSHRRPLTTGKYYEDLE